MKPYQARILLAASLLPLSPLWLRGADGTTTPSNSVVNAQTEVTHRQQLSVSANQAISDGQRFLASGEYDKAAERFQFAVDSLTPGGVSATSYNRAETGLAAAKAGQAQNLAKDFKFAEAATLLQQAVILQPNNPVYPADIDELKKEQIAYEEQIRDPEGTVNNPAVTDDFKARVAAAQKLLFQGDAYFATGQYDKSEETYSKVLLLDPYNKAARNKMDHVERYKERANGFRHEEYEQAAMETVVSGWSEQISPDVVAGPEKVLPNQGPSNRAIIQRKLESIIIDKVNFDKLDIATVIQYLQQKSKELDPDHQGINFVLRLTTDTSATPPDNGAAPAAAPTPGGTDTTAPAEPVHQIHREVSITLTDVPLSDILGYVIAQTNLQYTVEDYAVYLRPSIDEGETLSVRTYLVPPNFFQGSGLQVSPTTDQQSTTVSSIATNVQQALIDRGIRFPAGATATFLPGSSKLVVRDTPEQLDLIANLIDQLGQETPQVQIEAKIAEFTQDAIKSLSFNYLLGTGLFGAASDNVAGQTVLRTAGNTGTGIPIGTGDPVSGGPGALSPNGISQLIEQNSVAAASGTGYATALPFTGTTPISENAPNTLTLGAVVDDTGLAVIINAINNLQGVSLLSAPSVTTQNGLKANIDIVREFPYPTSFDKPKLSNSSNIGYSSGPGGPGIGTPPIALVLAIPPTPREFETQDVGVSLEVKPTTYPDQRIDLNISKCQVLDFQGFINYGVPITTATNADIGAQSLTVGIINQPVFNLRSMVTTLQVLDGQTAVLGGLTREDTQEINDKVPGLGDLPLIGRLFQSKVSDREKKDLVFFITARLIRSNGKPQYIKTLEAEPEEEALPEPDQQIGPGEAQPALPETTPNS